MKVSRSGIVERGRHSFFADAAAPPGATRVCQGLSCVLARAGGARLTPLPDAPHRDVHCLGHCHRSPARLAPDGVVESREAPEEEVRCQARRAVVTERIGRGDFSELEAARSAGVYGGLALALERGPAAVLDELESSGERGRGGAGFPTARKWRLCAAREAAERVVVANGDEGDAGSFVDRLLMERDPHAVLEGMAICAHAVGARRGIAYVRSEYPEARARLERAVAEARAAGLLGPGVLGSEFAFDVEVASGMGSYVCGEETALLESLEGRRGEVRVRPPYPVEEGLDGLPTVVNNVETLVDVPWIVREGGAAYRALGSQRTPGSKALCLSTGFARPGVLEVEYGIPLGEVVAEWAGGGQGGAALAGVVLGGPMGCIVLRDAWDVPLDPLTLRERGLELGHGGIVALPEGVAWGELLEHWLAFMADESCGKCVPCRLGSRRALELARVRDGETAALRTLLHLMRDTSLCGFGQRIPLVGEQLLDLARPGAGSAS